MRHAAEIARFVTSLVAAQSVPSDRHFAETAGNVENVVWLAEPRKAAVQGPHEPAALFDRDAEVSGAAAPDRHGGDNRA